MSPGKTFGVLTAQKLRVLRVGASWASVVMAHRDQGPQEADLFKVTPGGLRWIQGH